MAQHADDFLAAREALVEAAPYQPRLVLQRAFVEKVARAMRRLMMLQRVIGEMLLALGEHDAVDLHIGAWSDHGDVLVYFRQPATERADGPLQ